MWIPRWCTTTYGTKTQLFAAAIHIPIDPMQIIGPLQQIPVEEIGYTLPSLLLAAVGLRDG